MLPRSFITVFFAVAVASCSSSEPRPSYSNPVPLPVSSSTSCKPLPKGLRLYRGIAVKDIETAQRFPMRYPEQHYLLTTSELWVELRDGLRSDDVIYEYVFDDKWEEEGKFYTMHSGGLTAFRDGCTVRTQRVWTT